MILIGYIQIFGYLAMIEILDNRDKSIYKKSYQEPHNTSRFKVLKIIDVNNKEHNQCCYFDYVLRKNEMCYLPFSYYLDKQFVMNKILRSYYPNHTQYEKIKIE